MLDIQSYEQWSDKYRTNLNLSTDFAVIDEFGTLSARDILEKMYELEGDILSLILGDDITLALNKVFGETDTYVTISRLNCENEFFKKMFVEEFFRVFDIGEAVLFIDREENE